MGANPGSNPTSVAVESSGQILVTDEGHPSTTPLGLLYRIDPASGARTILSDLNIGANTGREPEGVAVEADGQILVVDKHAGPLTRGMLFRVDPLTGARAILSDFGAGPNGGGDPLALAVVPRRPATLHIVDEVVNDSGGTAVAGDFTVTVSGTDPSPASFPGATAPGTVVTLTTGAYSVSATGPAGYDSVPDAGCAGAIAPGETRTCTITHDDVPRDAGRRRRRRQRQRRERGGRRLDGNGARRQSVAGELPGRGRARHDGDARCEPLTSLTASGPPGYATTFSTGCWQQDRSGRDA